MARKNRGLPRKLRAASRYLNAARRKSHRDMAIAAINLVLNEVNNRVSVTLREEDLMLHRRGMVPNPSPQNLTPSTSQHNNLSPGNSSSQAPILHPSQNSTPQGPTISNLHPFQTPQGPTISNLHAFQTPQGPTISNENRVHTQHIQNIPRLVKRKRGARERQLDDEPSSDSTLKNQDTSRIAARSRAHSREIQEKRSPRRQLAATRQAAQAVLPIVSNPMQPGEETATIQAAQAVHPMVSNTMQPGEETATIQAAQAVLPIVSNPMQPGEETATMQAAQAVHPIVSNTMQPGEETATIQAAQAVQPIVSNTMQPSEGTATIRAAQAVQPIVSNTMQPGEGTSSSCNVQAPLTSPSVVPPGGGVEEQIKIIQSKIAKAKDRVRGVKQSILEEQVVKVLYSSTVLLDILIDKLPTESFPVSRQELVEEFLKRVTYRLSCGEAKVQLFEDALSGLMAKSFLKEVSLVQHDSDRGKLMFLDLFNGTHTDVKVADLDEIRNNLKMLEIKESNLLRQVGREGPSPVAPGGA